MKSLKKTVVMIILSALVFGAITCIPGFAETQEELKNIFVTREEFFTWAYGTNAAGEDVTTGMSEILRDLEENMMEKIKRTVENEMIKRGLTTPTEESESSS